MKDIWRAMPVILVLALGLGPACSEKSSTGNGGVVDIEDLLVRNNEITGWTYFGVGWVARNYDELYDAINGGGEIYRDHGFEEAAGQKYEGTIDGGTRTLEIWVFDQGSQANAKATYDDPSLGLTSATPWTGGAGDEAHHLSTLSQILAFYRGPYYVLLTVNHGTEKSLNILKQFALNIDGKIE
jgi:hypothetical protein